MEHPEGPGPDIVARLENVSLTLTSAAGPVNILRQIDLSVHRGEMLSIVGPSGSGKSTMMSIMAGLERPSGGSVVIAGHRLETLDEDALALFRRDNLGIVFQSFHLVPTLSALENVALPLELSGARDAFSKARSELDAVGLSHRHHHYPVQLSGGEQQRVALARALVGAPKLILADEPTGNLDGVTGQQIADLLFELPRRRAATLVLITHDKALAERCDRVVEIENGRLLA